MKTENLNPMQSLEVIMEAIGDARAKFEEDGFIYIFWGSFLGPSISVIHGVVPNHMRAISSAVFFFVLNLIGLGLGPTFVGIMSDILLPYFPEDSIRWAMALCMITSAIGAGLYWISARKLAHAG